MTDLQSSPVYQRLNARSLHQGVVQQIARRIVGGELVPGDVMPNETDLAEQFGVSRTVIREAVRILVAKGLISVRHGRGIRVEPHDTWNFLDPQVLFEQVRVGRGDDILDEVLEVRRMLEVEVAALAAERLGRDDLAALGATLMAMTDVVGDPDAYTEVDIRFHDQILAAARNRLLREALRPVTETLRVGRFLTVRLPGGAEKSLVGHQEIFAAIERRDVDSAREAMRRHVQQFEHDIRDSLRPKGSQGLGNPKERQVR